MPSIALDDPVVAARANAFLTLVGKTTASSSASTLPAFDDLLYDRISEIIGAYDALVDALADYQPPEDVIDAMLGDNNKHIVKGKLFYLEPESQNGFWIDGKARVKASFAEKIKSVSTTEASCIIS